MRPTNTRATVEAGIMSAIAIVFALISAYVPVIGAFVTLLWPVPIILLGVRHGFRWSLMATVVAGVLCAILIQPLKAISIVVGFGLIGLVFGHAFRERFGPFKTILWGSVATLISTAGLIAINMFIIGINPVEMMLGDMDSAIVQAAETYRRMGMAEEQIERMAASMKTMIALFRVVLPGSFVLGAIMQTYINFIIARVVLRRLGHPVPSFPPFKEWTLPLPMLYILYLGSGLLFAGQYMQLELLNYIGANALIVTFILFAGQGLALFYYLADKYNLSRLIRNIILIIILTNNFFLLFVTLAGIYDLAVDYRRLKMSRSP